MWFSRSLKALRERLTAPAGTRRRQSTARLSVEQLEVRCVPSTVPNDPLFDKLYGMQVTEADRAWDLTTGSTQVVVADIDTGVDYTHPDLYKNIWLNQAEIPSAVRHNLQDIDGDGLITFWDLNESVNQGPGKITDLNGNGYIDGGDLLRPVSEGGWADGRDGGNNGFTDDLIGWDFFGNDNDPMDGLQHGTHIAGTIGAVGNNGVGVTGVAWQLQIMPVKYKSDVADIWTVQNVFDSIYYAVDNGARVSNNSYGAPATDLTEAQRAAGYAAVQYAASRGHLIVAAAGNDGRDTDGLAQLPSSYDLPNVISVAATTRNDKLAHFSNYGATSVDLGAPGVNVRSTLPGGDYEAWSGTSMATPQVTGAAALILARNPGLGYAQVKALILDNVDPLPALEGKTVTGGRLNIFKAVNATPASTTVQSAEAPETQTATTWSVEIGTAPHALTNAAGTPQDTHLTATGNNTDGWHGGGVVVLGRHSQLFAVDQRAVLQANIVAGGLIGVDGSPVLPGTYLAPSPEIGDRTFEVVSGRTFYLIVDLTVVNSNITDSFVGPIPVGATYRLMLTFDPTEGRSEQLLVTWLDVGGSFVPFLNEGVMMTNLHKNR